MVQPTTFFGLRAMRSTLSEPVPITELELNTEGVEAVTGCSGSQITPECLANLYSFTSATAQTVGKIGIAGFLEQWPSKSDLSSFMSSYQTEGNSKHTYSCTLVNGGTCPSSGSGYPGVEANLDAQYVAAITESIPTVYYSTGGRPPWLGSGTNTNEPYLEFLNYLIGLADADLPNTISISYGDDESTVPLDYANNACNLFSQLGARGVSVLVASGDSGVGDTCQENGEDQFTTSFPASCPWVTTVGGTTGNSPEGAWTGSGGGFSSIFGRPSYQNTVVSSWLTNDKTHTAVSQYFNSSGRAYPDVAAQSTNFVVEISGSANLVSGTSAATPTFASIIQLINSDRISKGKAGLGFLNPWLYSSAASGLTDITKGKNTGCSGVISGAGFSAVSVSLHWEGDFAFALLT
jgi:tripeptidyl-peptidase-1